MTFLKFKKIVKNKQGNTYMLMINADNGFKLHGWTFQQP